MANCENLQLELHRQYLRRRSRRVILLLATLLVLGLADLHLTIHHHATIGLEELNPIGAYLLNSEQIGSLVVFKLASLCVAVGVLLAVRKHAVGEVSTWLAFAIMVALTLHWHQYNTELTTNLAGDYPQLSTHLRLSMADS